MTVFCTDCSAEKNHSEGEMPAIQRYKSTRIKSVYSAAKSLGLGFVILSGKYGILEPGDPILYYDHLLQSSEVSEHSNLVAGQLEVLGVKDLIFFSRLAPVVEPYRECIKSASEKAGVELKCVYLPMDDA